MRVTVDTLKHTVTYYQDQQPRTLGYSLSHGPDGCGAAEVRIAADDLDQDLRRRLEGAVHGQITRDADDVHRAFFGRRPGEE